MYDLIGQLQVVFQHMCYIRWNLKFINFISEKELTYLVLKLLSSVTCRSTMYVNDRCRLVWVEK